MKKIRYFLEYLLVKFWLFLMHVLSLKRASDFASCLFRAIGPRLKVSNVARKNIKMIFPELASGKIEAMVEGVWDNFGRMAAETPIFLDMPPEELDKHVKVMGLEHINELKGKPALFFTAHIANWEVSSKALMSYGVRFHAVYRAANNKLVDKIINDLRAKVDIQLIPKGRTGAKKIINALQDNAHIVMLIDQKMNDGIKVPFMGKNAMTAPAIASLALKYGCPIVPIHAIRRDKYNFDIIVDKPLDYTNLNVEEIMTLINERVAEWVRAEPEQWFWLHRRWMES